MTMSAMKARKVRAPLSSFLVKLLLVFACLAPNHVVSEQTFCPIIASLDDNMSIETRDSTQSFNEISGLAVSPTQIAPSGQPVLFGINDGGGGERIGLFDSGTGDRLMTLRVPSNIVTNSDWESLTIGSCGATAENKTCLYIADTGDNRARTSSGETSRRDSRYRLAKIEEPQIGAYSDNDMLPESTVSVLNFSYRSQSSPTNRADCEAIFLDHTGWGEGGEVGDLYLVTKWDRSDYHRKTRLFKFPTAVWLNTTGTYKPEAVGSYDGGGSLMGVTWTGADSSFDGKLVSLVGYTSDEERTKNYLFLRCPGATMAETLAAPNGATQHCLEWRSPVQGKLESFAWSPESTKTFNIPEGSNVNMGVTTFVYDPLRTNYSCPEVAWVEGPLGTFCETKADAVRKPDAWCEAAYPNSTLQTDDNATDTLQATPPPTVVADEEEEEDKPHDTLQPPKNLTQSSPTEPPSQQPTAASTEAATSTAKQLKMSLLMFIFSVLGISAMNTF